MLSVAFMLMRFASGHAGLSAYGLQHYPEVTELSA